MIRLREAELELVDDVADTIEKRWRERSERRNVFAYVESGERVHPCVVVVQRRRAPFLPASRVVGREQLEEHRDCHAH